MMIFAFLMSGVTSSFVSAFVLIVTLESMENFISDWFSSFVRAWPIVFILILVFVPAINKFLNQYFSLKK